MLKKLCAIGLIVLAASPFTAPFQTFDNFGNPDPLHAKVNGDTLTTPAVSSVVLGDDAGSLIGPPPSRVRLEVSSVVSTSTLATPQIVAFRTRSIASLTRVSPHASPPIALRV